ncbi:MAG: DUF4153 domain-containing protein [Brevundimonas sp.]
MTETADAAPSSLDMPESASDRRDIILARLAIGLVQGLALYGLMRATEGEASWSRLNPDLFAPAVLVALFLPAVLLSGVGKLRLPVYLAWSGVAAALLALLAWHDVARQAGVTREATFPVFVFGAAALFIAHHLVVPADRARHLIASFPAYFDAAWMSGVQMVLSLAFAGAFWLLLFLGAELFRVIGLTFLSELMRQGWFALPATGLAFAAAVELTDVRDGLIRGVRTVALTLLSWLLLVLTGLVAAFLIALPFTGLEGLWSTGRATSLVLAAAAILIVLINAAYQDGQTAPPRVLQLAARVAAVLLTPMILLGAWGLYLRTGQYGLTPDRIIALACVIVGAAHAVGYGYAAVSTLRRETRWMQPLERTNLAGAVLALITILALFTPVADPARLAVADQVGRLESGRTAPDRFDYAFLRFDSGRVGMAALQRLARSSDPRIAEPATAAVALAAPVPPSPAGATPRFEPATAGASIPDGLAQPVLADDPRYGCQDAGACVVLGRDLDGDGRDEALIATADIIYLMTRSDAADWRQAGMLFKPCNAAPDLDLRDTLRRGELALDTAPRWPTLRSADGSLPFTPGPCPTGAND